jgi:hypothetical protein
LNPILRLDQEGEHVAMGVVTMARVVDADIT